MTEPTPDDLLVLDVTNGDYFSLGPVGAFIWQRLDGETSLGAIAVQVATGWKKDQQTAERHVLEFAANLADRGLTSTSRKA